MQTVKIEKPNNILLSGLYIMMYVVMPAVLLLISLGLQEEAHPEPFIVGTSRVLFYFVTLPIYAVYAYMIFKRVASLASKWVLLLFLPQFFNLGWHLYNQDFASEVFDLLVLDSITTLCGIYFCLFIGLNYLIYIKSAAAYKKEGLKGLIARVLVTILLISLIFIPVLFFFLRGWHLSLTDATTLPIWAISKYIFSVLLVMFAHYPVIIELYKEGRF